MAELRAVVIAGPDPEVHKVIRWRCVDLCGEVARRFSVTVPERTMGKWLGKLGLTRLQPRPQHPKKDAAAQDTFKKRLFDVSSGIGRQLNAAFEPRMLPRLVHGRRGDGSKGCVYARAWLERAMEACRPTAGYREATQ
jgi:hypothetical protein